ncbi:DNA polymerase III subunit delta [Halioxenophilus sp. WMMB6]|uniref:DNA polymerase III subunit delta n=1 Tax=Halioxenophilus sp. WMMB6 TaxID=3073815 RepID=UPI00295E48F6|nr:DNA polymerase III subunit delta [Halioxenophilus sp. WMMB6]
MNKLRPEQLAGHCRKPLAQVYIIAGDEPLLQQEACDTIRRAATEQGFSERERYYGDSTIDWQQLLAGAANFSLFAERKLIEVHFYKAKLNEEANQALCHYASEIPDDTILLITTPKLDGNSQKAKWFKALDPHAVLLTVWPVTVDALPAWIDQRLRQAGLKASSEAIEILAAKVEGNLLAASQEIEKLKLLVGQEELIDTTSMANLVGDSARYDLFSLVDRALAGDAASAVKTLVGLQSEGTDSVIILWSLAREIRTLAELHELLQSGRPIEQALNQLRVWEKRKPIMRQALSRISARHSQHLLRKAYGIDRAIKGMRRADPWSELKDLVLHLAGAVCLPPGLDLLALDEEA